MPTYDYQCQVCKEYHEEIRSIANMYDGTVCCGQVAKKVLINAPMVDDYFLGSTKNEGYMSPLSDKYVSTKKQRRSEMSEFNVVPKE